MKKVFLLIILFFTVSLFFFSCDSNRIFEENKSLADNFWERNNKISFEANIDDTNLIYNVYINIRNGSAYAYSNLYIFLVTKMPDGKVSKDTLNCYLQDQTGHWAGKGLGDAWESRILFKPMVKFNQKGKFVFEYEQGMREEKLSGIMDVGLRIEKATQ